MLGVIPTEHKSISTSVIISFQFIGQSFSGLLAAWLLKAGVLKDSWVLFGNQVSFYDGIIFAYAVLIFLMSVTLGLVPSVLRPAEWMPGNT